MDNWFDGILSEGQAAPARPLESGYKSEMGTKVGTAEILAQQGFQDFVPTVPTVPTEKQSPRKSEENTPKPGNPFTAMATGQPTPALPADLLEQVNLICRLEQWPAADRVEWLGILRRQLEQDGTPVRGLVACLDTHLAKHHAGMVGNDDREAIEERAAIMECDGGLLRAEAERLASQVNDCMTCRYWQGVQSYPSPRHKALRGSGPSHEPRSLLMGACAKHQRPWRVSNVPGDANYSRWHLVGQCGYSKAVDWEHAA